MWRRFPSSSGESRPSTVNRAGSLPNAAHAMKYAQGAGGARGRALDPEKNEWFERHGFRRPLDA